LPSWKKVIISGSNAALNSLNVSNGITGSLFGTASFASNGGVTQLLAGPNITLSPTNGKGQVTVSSTSGGGGFNTATGSYGSFYDTTTQTNVAGTARSMSFNTTDITNGVSISGSTNPFNTYIKTENAGVYDIQFSAQVDKTDSGTDEIWIWLRKNGTNLTDTATSIQLVGNEAHYVAAWNFFVNSAANDYYQLMWYSPDANVRLHAEPEFGVVPGIPSVIVTANRVDQFLSNTGSFTGSFTGVFTGSLFGTSSFASTAQTASFVTGSNVFGPFGSNSVISASFAQTASFLNSTTNAFIQNGNSFGTTALLGTNDNQPLALETNGTTRMFISSSGDVGIGTTSPNGKLEIRGIESNTKDLLLNLSKFAYGTTQFYQNYSNTFYTAGKSLEIEVEALPLLQLAVNNAGSQGKVIFPNGNVGIGTTSPGGKLHISGAGSGLALTFGNSVPNNPLFINTYGDWSGIGMDQSNAGLRLVGDYTSGASLVDIGYYSSGTVSHANWVSKVKVMQSGNVGIGTTSPTYKFEVSDGTRTGVINPNSGLDAIFIGVTQSKPLIFGTGDTERMRITSAGNVLIGTTTDGGNRLEVVGTANNWAGSFTGNTTTGQSYGAIVRGGTNSSDVAFNVNNAANSTTYLNVRGDGNVGIGTTSPDAPLDIENTNATSIIYQRTGVSAKKWGFVSDNSNTYWSNITDNTLPFTLSNSGNVGIGTTGPSQKLDVSGSAYIAGNIILPQNPTGTTYGNGVSASPPYMINQGAGDNDAIRFYAESAATNQVSMVFEVNDDIETAGSEWIWRNKKTYGGYEATTPMRLSGAGELEVSKIVATSITGSLLGTASFAQTASFLNSTTNAFIQNGNSFGTTALLGTNDNQPLALETNGTTRMFISSSGDVGIGTTSSLGPLEVYRGNSGGLGGHIIVNNNGLAIGSSTALMFGDGPINGIRGAISTTTEDSPYYGQMDFKTGADIYSNLFTRMTIKGNGNVGIGTTSPSYKLDVLGDIGAYANGDNNGFIGTAGGTHILSLTRSTNNAKLAGYDGVIFYTNATTLAGGSERMRITSAGDVGIGTTSPNRLLTVAGTTSGLIALNASSYRNTTIGSDSVGNFIVYDDTASSYRMVINSSGNVGIGTTTPQRKLDVISGANNFVSVGIDAVAVGQWAGLHFGYAEGANNLYRKSAIVFERTDLTSNNAQGKVHILNGPQGNADSATLADSKLTIAENGNVGIGTTNPLYKLDVNGTGRFSSDLLTNARFGVGSTNINSRVFASAFSGELATAIFTTFDSAQGTQEAARFSTSDLTTGAVRIYPRVGVANFNGITVADSAVIVNATTKPILLGVQDGSAVQFTETDIRIGTNNSEKMRITSSGNVGIGISTPTLGTLQVNGNVFATSFTGSLQVTSSLSYNSSLSTSNVNGEIAYWGGGTVAAGTLYYYDSSGNWTAADADAESTSTGMLGIALAAGTASTVGILLRGHARFTGVSSFTGTTTVGAKLYVSTTAGAFSQTAPTGTGDVVRIIGYVQSTANDQIYFCPDTTWVTLL
jgi:hypothetical protein